jgi:hypothetical protein
MIHHKSWILTDTANDLWVDTFHVGADRWRLPGTHDWSISQRTLHGGPREGVAAIEVNNGALAFTVLPTRGMGLWRGRYRGTYLGWQSPVHGPVHPGFVNLTERNGLGWLNGFDEWLCRCGLAWNGPPGDDTSGKLTLHGRVANLPAHFVEVRVGLEAPHELSVVGQVDETGLFGSQLRLTTTYTTLPGSNRLVIHDVVENRGGSPAEVQMLYHCNVGAPFLEAGSRVLVPLREMAPRDARAAEGVATYETFDAPHIGFAEQVYYYDPLADAEGHALALLCNRPADRGLVVRWRRSELPCFAVWKNTAALEDGYVTGLEPATNYPNFKSFERQQGRVKQLSPGGRWQCTWAIEVHDTAAGVAGVLTEVARLQAQAPAVVHRTPQTGYSR